MNHGFFKDDNGNDSISRLLPFIGAVTLLCLTALYSSEKGITDIPEGWSWFLLGIYGVSKAKPAIEYISNIFKKEPKP